MGASDKILTVSYGCFSCRIEGVEDPVDTFRHIAGVMGDLTTRHRGFGTVTPAQARVMRRLAEDEAARAAAEGAGPPSLSGAGLALPDASEAPQADAGAAPQATPHAPRQQSSAPGPRALSEPPTGRAARRDDTEPPKDMGRTAGAAPETPDEAAPVRPGPAPVARAAQHPPERAEADAGSTRARAPALRRDSPASGAGGEVLRDAPAPSPPATGLAPPPPARTPPPRATAGPRAGEESLGTQPPQQPVPSGTGILGNPGKLTGNPDTAAPPGGASDPRSVAAGATGAEDRSASGLAAEGAAATGPGAAREALAAAPERPGRQRLQAAVAEEAAALDRLIRHTEMELDRSGAQERHDLLARLRGAVVARRAGEAAGAPPPGASAAMVERFREDLASAMAERPGTAAPNIQPTRSGTGTSAPASAAADAKSAMPPSAPPDRAGGLQVKAPARGGGEAEASDGSPGAGGAGPHQATASPSSPQRPGGPQPTPDAVGPEPEPWTAHTATGGPAEPAEPTSVETFPAGASGPPTGPSPRPEAPVESTGRPALHRQPQPQTDPTEDSFRGFARSVGAEELPDIIAAAAAYMAQVEGVPAFSRRQVMHYAASLGFDDRARREDGLRAFGGLLREGRIVRSGRGQFSLGGPDPHSLTASSAPGVPG